MASEALPGTVTCRLASAARLVGLFVFFAAGCGGAGPLSRWSPARSAHEAYAESLRAAGLEGSAMGRTWLVTADAASNSAQPVSLRSEEHTSELQSRLHLVCRLLLEKKNKTQPRT